MRSDLSGPPVRTLWWVILYFLRIVNPPLSVCPQSLWTGLFYKRGEVERLRFPLVRSWKLFWTRVSVADDKAETLINSLSINARTLNANHHSKVETQELRSREGLQSGRLFDCDYL